MTAAPTLDVEAIRRDFPILSREVYGKPLVYLDNAASAQKPRQVIDAMTRLMEQDYANVHRGLHYLANASTEAYEAARESVRKFLNARQIEEIVFTRSATGALNTIASCLGRHLGSGRATRSSCRSWSITPTSCPGISGASGMARSSDGRRWMRTATSSWTSSRS